MLTAKVLAQERPLKDFPQIAVHLELIGMTSRRSPPSTLSAFVCVTGSIPNGVFDMCMAVMCEVLLHSEHFRGVLQSVLKCSKLQHLKQALCSFNSPFFSSKDLLKKFLAVLQLMSSRLGVYRAQDFLFVFRSLVLFHTSFCCCYITLSLFLHWFQFFIDLPVIKHETRVV